MLKNKKAKSKNTIQFFHDNYNSENVFKDLNSNSQTTTKKGKIYRKTPFKPKQSLEAENKELTPSKSEIDSPADAKKMRISTKLEFESEEMEEESNESFSFIKLCSDKSFDLNDSFIDAVPTDELFNSSSISNLEDSVIKSAKVYESDDGWESENESLDEPEPNEMENIKAEVNLETVEKNCQSVGTYFDLPEGKLVILPPNKEVGFYGLTEIEILYGKIEVLGYELEKTDCSIKIYSPRGAAHLTIKNVHDNSAKLNSIEYLVPALQKYENIRSASRVRRNCSIFLCRQLKDAQIEFIKRHISQNIVPLQKGMIFEPPGCDSDFVKSSADWYKLADGFHLDSRVMLVGGKGVGKSTLMKFIINRLLNRFEKVRVIDLDPGQPEFTVPGVISISTVESPIFGPNYTHLSTPDCSFLCHINVAHDPQLYLKTVNRLVSLANNQLSHLPTIINYMGFSQGLGIHILAAAVNSVQPTNIVQIQSHNDTKNFKYPLNAGTFEEMTALFVERKNLNINAFVLHEIQSLNKRQNIGWRLESRQIREMCLLAYLGRLKRPILDENVPIYEISLSDVNLANLDGHSVLPAAANANIVALCSRSNNDLFQYFGCGIVRGIDTTTGKLYLITPDADNLTFVNYLIVGVVPLPPSIYMTVEKSGTVPYVMQGELEFLGKITKRSFRPLNNNN